MVRKTVGIHCYCENETAWQYGKVLNEVESLTLVKRVSSKEAKENGKNYNGAAALRSGCTTI